MLLEMDQPSQALQAFEASMRVEPNRFHGLAGAARAAELLGDSEKACTSSTALLELAAQADTERTQLQQARASSRAAAPPPFMTCRRSNKHD